MNIKNALQSLKDNGGFSFNFSTGQLNPSTGFMVAIRKDTEVQVSNIIRYKESAVEEAVKQYSQTYADLLSEPSVFLGAWIDKGILYLDASELVDSEDRAIELCKLRDQLAYFDNEKKETIFI